MKKKEVGERISVFKGVSISPFKMPISLGTILKGYLLPSPNTLQNV
jgi:hypothetical protein